MILSAGMWFLQHRGRRADDVPKRVIKILTIEFKLGKKYSEDMKEMKGNKKV